MTKKYKEKLAIIDYAVGFYKPQGLFPRTDTGTRMYILKDNRVILDIKESIDRVAECTVFDSSEEAKQYAKWVTSWTKYKTDYNYVRFDHQNNITFSKKWS